MAKRDPKVSIIIPVYNGSNFLANAIDSALAQTYRNIEVVVVNDGSTDNGETERIALSYGNKISYYQKKNGGVSSALNFGIKKMRGEYFSWLSHDDIYEKTKVEEEIEYLLARSDPAHTIVACNSFTLFESGIKKKEKINQTVFDNHFDIFLGASAKVGLNGCSLLIPRQLLIKDGGFKEDLPVTQDYDLWNRLKDRATFVLLDKNLVVYRHHDMQDSIQKFSMSLVAGDDLRSRILQGISKNDFAHFMESHKKNEKWLWDNYAIYRTRGYIKIPLAMLYLLARYYGHDTTRALRVRSELLVFERRYSNDLKQFGDKNMLIAEKTKILIKSISSKDYKSHPDSDGGNKLVGYIESIKSDGLLFVIEKAARKLGRIVRRK